MTGVGTVEIPLVIGVTGHRDLVLEEYGVIKGLVRDFLLELQRSYPQLPLLIMTPLADDGTQRSC
jgi:hypothetical protein